MPVIMPADTRLALGEDAKNCDSRSLFLDKFADPGAKDAGNDHPRRKWFNELRRKPAMPHITRFRQDWLARRVDDGQGRLLYAQLQSRLMVNMAGGVMENAGLCLDRFGLPIIPGSAVKGCARRMAMQELIELEDVEAKAELLTRIALSFGWGDTDWSPGRKPSREEGRAREPYSDFWWAMANDDGDISADGLRNERWHEVFQAVAARLLAQVPATPREQAENLPQLSSFGGSISFLPAHPFRLGAGELPLKEPDVGAMDLDVVTCHHGDYYSNSSPKATAGDTEEPVPVIFPAIAPGHLFAFGILPLRGCPPTLLETVCGWLRAGLESFGLGAKSASGYGWFDCGEHVQKAVRREFEEQRQREVEERRREAEHARQKELAEASRAQREADKVALANLTPEQQEDYRLAKLTADQFRSALEEFARKEPEEQKAIVRALRLASGSGGGRRAFWEDLKAKAQKKGGKAAQIEQAIRLLSKQMYPGKEGKMP